MQGSQKWQYHVEQAASGFATASGATTPTSGEPSYQQFGFKRATIFSRTVLSV